MSLDIANDIWQVLKPFINKLDREEAADQLISVLVDNHGVDPVDIQDEFKIDSSIKAALGNYINMSGEEEPEKYIDYEEDEDDDEDHNSWDD